MTLPDSISRRTLLMKLGIAFNAVIGGLLAIPIVGYLASPLTRARKSDYESWLPLGTIELYPPGPVSYTHLTLPTTPYV